MKEENETSEASGDNHETTVVTNSCAFEGEVEDRVYAAEVGTDEQELAEPILKEELSEWACNW